MEDFIFRSNGWSLVDMQDFIGCCVNTISRTLRHYGKGEGI